MIYYFITMAIHWVGEEEEGERERKETFLSTVKLHDVFICVKQEQSTKIHLQL
jgi:hypothetical protein